MHHRKILAILCSVAAAFAAHATTVIPPTFEDLVSRAQTIFQGTVTGVRSEWTGEGAQRHIGTYVTFKVNEMLKGPAENEMMLQMLGGTVGDRTMEVTDAPKFKVGDRDILFVENNGTQFIPLVGIMHGRFRVKNDDAGQEIVTTNDGAAVTDLAQMGRERQAAASARGLTAREFKQSIRSTVAGAKNIP